MESVLIKISIMLVPALFAVTLHEVAHGYTAERFGDPTARLLGRLTLNPFKHLDPIGTLALMIFGFGWARPVPVNFGNLRQPRRDMILVALSGPLTNLSLAALSAMLLKGLSWLQGAELITPQWAYFIEPLSLMAAFSLFINILLGVLNLLPIPPLDGGRVLSGLLPAKQAAVLARLEPFGFLLVILILFSGLGSGLLQQTISFLVDLFAWGDGETVRRVISFLLGSS